MDQLDLDYSCPKEIFQKIFPQENRQRQRKWNVIIKELQKKLHDKNQIGHILETYGKIFEHGNILLDQIDKIFQDNKLILANTLEIHEIERYCQQIDNLRKIIEKRKKKRNFKDVQNIIFKDYSPTKLKKKFKRSKNFKSLVTIFYFRHPTLFFSHIEVTVDQYIQIKHLIAPDLQELITLYLETISETISPLKTHQLFASDNISLMIKDLYESYHFCFSASEIMQLFLPMKNYMLTLIYPIDRKKISPALKSILESKDDADAPPVSPLSPVKHSDVDVLDFVPSTDFDLTDSNSPIIPVLMDDQQEVRFILLNI